MSKEENTFKIKKLTKNYWAIATIILAVLLIIVLITNVNSKVGKNKAGELALDFLNSRVGEGVELVKVNSEGSLYEVIVLYQEQEIPVYITADGEKFVGGIMPLTGQTISDQQSQTQQTEEYSEEDLEKISIFIDCLAKKEVKIYGANWCGWTKKLVVETLGGFDIAEPIYIECTEDEELCSSEGIEGYPTIKINGELYEGDRTFEGLAEATACPAPEIEVQLTSTGEASCS